MASRPHRGRIAAAGLLSLALVLAGCATSSGGRSGTCKYGLRHLQDGGNHCFSRPDPTADQLAKSTSPATIAQALVAYKRSGGAREVASIGINQWAETSFAADSHTVATFDAAGKPTSGDDGYAYKGRDPFPISQLKPKSLAKILERVRTRQPATRLLGAILLNAPFAPGLVWNVSIVSEGAGSAIVYQASPNGGDLCHGDDTAPQDKLVPAPDLPACANSVLPAYSVVKGTPK